MNRKQEAFAMNDAEIQLLTDKLSHASSLLKEIAEALEENEPVTISTSPEEVVKAAGLEIDIRVWVQTEKEFLEGLRSLYLRRQQEYNNVSHFMRYFKAIFAHPMKESLEETRLRLASKTGEVRTDLVAEVFKEVCDRVDLVVKAVPKGVKTRKTD